MVNLAEFKLKADSIIKRHPSNPILTAKDVPYDATLVFNSGVTKYQGRYVMVFRNDYGVKDEKEFRKVFAHCPEESFKSNMGIAFSDDGIKWEVQPEPFFELADDDIIRAYDPRLTVIDGKCYICFAVDTRHGIRGGIMVTEDFDRVEILSLSVPDNRNMVLFPGKIDGKFFRLERPFPVYGRPEAEAFDIWLGASPDCRYWGDFKLILGAEHVPFCNSKIGPSAPPVRTKAGWLTTFHAVYTYPDREFYSWHDQWHKFYTFGIMLLDADDPSIVKGICPKPLMKPEYPYETKGFREAIFPGGMILEDNGEVKIYYGAGDLVSCLATAHVDDLIALCKPLIK